MISIRRARPSDALGIATVHVWAWRNSYAGILPDAFLAGLSVPRQTVHYDGAIRAGVGVYVATASGLDLPGGTTPRIVGFATGGPVSARLRPGKRLAEGEIETIYIMDDWRDRGLGRRLMRAEGAHLAAAGCRSAFLWVLRDNPNRWFYSRLGGKPVAEQTIKVGGAPVVQVAFVWDPIERLLQASPTAS
jgi:ribosomal protein S18 acetylase RimI-like enzyme